MLYYALNETCTVQWKYTRIFIKAVVSWHCHSWTVEHSGMLLTLETNDSNHESDSCHCINCLMLPKLDRAQWNLLQFCFLPEIHICGVCSSRMHKLQQRVPSAFCTFKSVWEERELSACQDAPSSKCLTFSGLRIINATCKKSWSMLIHSKL